MSDLISRSALLEASECCDCPSCGDCDCDFFYISIEAVENAPAVDAVMLPDGRPGDYLEWDNGVGYRQIYSIHSVMICEDCMRYELADFSPVVSHEGIVRILSREEAETLVKERGKAWKYMWCEDDNKTTSGLEG